MNNFETKEIESKKEWEDFLLSRNPGTFLQSWNWGEVNQKVGFKIFRLGFYKSKKLVGCALIIHQPAKRGSHLLIPGGPVIDYDDKELLRFVIQELEKLAKKERVWFVRIRPDIKDNPDIRTLLKRMGLISAPMHVHGENTLVLDLKKSEDEILKAMRKTTRYLIKKSLREGYQVIVSSDTKRIKSLYNLQNETVKRHKFVGFREVLLRSELEVFSKDKQALLFECRKGKNLLASALIVFYAGKSFYHYSGSSYQSLKTNASYYLQWEIIKKSKSLGMRYYDFWGISSKDDPKHRFWGVTLFKKGFGGERIDWLHAHDLPVKNLYWFTFVFEMMRKKFRHL